MVWWKSAQYAKASDKKSHESKRSRLLLQALEPRLMFDGAAATTVAAVAHVDVPLPAERSLPESPSPDSTHSGSDGSTEKIPALLEPAAAKQVVFIESNVSNYQSLINQLPAGMEVVILDASKDGLSQIAAWAKTHQGYAAIHIISHGESADLMLGSNELTTTKLDSRQADLATIGQSLSPGGDILLYGCDVAAGSSGATFINTLAQYTHADVAASTDATGAASLGGNWTLERSSGHIDVATLDLTQYNGLLTRPSSGTTTFDTIDGYGSVIPIGQTSLTVSDYRGWNFTMQMNSASDGASEMIIVEKDFPSSVETVDAVSDGSKQINYFSVKPNDSSLFTLNSISVVLDGYNSSFSGGTLVLQGYLNGSMVSGATLSQFVPDFNSGGTDVTFNVSGNSNFVGIDSFRVVPSTGNNVTGLIGIGAINATDFHFPGPTLTSSGGSSAYSSGTGNAVAVDSGLTLSDTAASTQTSATVSITGNFHSGEDVLAFTNNGSTMGNISASYNSGTGVLTLSSSGSTATNAQWQAALAAVTYQDSSLTPNTSSRTISFAITDASSNTSATVTKTVTVAADAAPTISNLNGDSNTFYAGNGAVHLDTGTAATVTDSDTSNFNGGNVTVHISANGQSGEDALGVDTSGTVTLSSGTSVGSTVSISGVAIGTIASNGDGVGGHDLIVTLNSNATAGRVTTLVDSLTYNDTSAGIPNTATRTIQVTVNDGRGSTSSAASVTMAVSAAPLVTASGGSAAFTAGDNTASTPVVVDSGITVTDNASPTLASGTVSITGNFHSGEDVLAFSNTSSSLFGNIAGSYNSATGLLTLTSSGATATLAQWQAALRSVTYTDSAVTPNSSTRTISFQVADGSSNTSSVVTRTITVADTDQTPIATTSGGSAAFTAGDNTVSTPVVVDSGFTVSDLDNTTLASGTVSMTGNFHSGEDVLSFTNTSAVTYGNIVASYNSGTGVLTLTSSGATATLAQWQAAMRAVTYTDSAVTPNTATRTISFSVNDGSKSSAATSRTVTVSSTDQTPLVSASGGSAAFTAGDNVTSTPVAVDSGITVSDLDNTTLASATVAITGNFHSSEDVLAFTNNGSTMGNIVASYNSGTGVLTLTSSGATATLAQWQAALRAVTYTDSAITPNNATRTISFSVNDGSKDSAVVIRSVTVADTDQTPIVTTTGGNGSYMLSSTPTAVVVDGAITLSDRDNTTLASATVAITGNFHSSEDVLSFTNNGSTMGNIAASYNSGTGVLTLTSSGATATLAQWQAALQAVTYNDTASVASTATRTISFVVNDGTTNSTAATRSMAIQLPAPTVSGLTTATDTGSSNTDGITSNNTPTVTGTALAGSTVTVYVDGVSAGSTTADGSGAWSYNVASSLVDGSHAITAMATSGSVNSSVSSAYSIAIDTSAPGAPTSLALTTASDTGSSHNDGITGNNMPTVQGSAEANSTVTVYVDGSAVGTATANGSGAWSYTLSSALADGSHSIRATATDTAGNVSALATAYSITVDTVAPQVQSITPLDPVSTSSSSARYDIVFSKAVSGLTADAFNLISSGSAHGVIVSLVAISDSHYIVTLGSLGGDGSLALAVKQNGASDVAGNSNAQQFVAQAYQLLTPVVTTPSAPSPAPVTVPDSTATIINVGTITPNIVLAAVSGSSHPVSTGSVVPASMGDPSIVGQTAGQIQFGQDHFSSSPLEPFGSAHANPSFVSNLAGSTGPALQVMPDLGVQQLQAGQGFTFNLPRSTVITQGADIVLNVQVRQSNGQPLPAWLKFDPQTGRFSGTPPAGWDKSLSLEITFRDQQGHRGVSHIKLQTRQGQQAAAASDKVAIAGKPALHEQFRQHGKLSFDEQVAEWLHQENIV